MDIRVVYYVDKLVDIVNLEMIMSYHCDKLANFVILSSDSKVENIVDEAKNQIGVVGDFDEDRIGEMAPLPTEDSIVMVGVSQKNKSKIENILQKMNFQENQIINY